MVGVDHRSMLVMPTTQGPRPTVETVAADTGVLDIVRVLLLLQGAIAFVNAIEALVGSTAFGLPLSPAFLATASGALATLWLAARIGRRSRRVRKVVFIAQIVWMVFAAIDLLLSLFLTQTPLELVPLLTRVVLPAAILYLLRRPATRALFGVTTRRERRASDRRRA